MWFRTPSQTLSSSDTATVFNALIDKSRFGLSDVSDALTIFLTLSYSAIRSVSYMLTETLSFDIPFRTIRPGGPFPIFRPTRSDSARWIVSIAGIRSSLSYTRNLLDILTKRLRFVALVGSLAVSQGVQTVPSVRNGASKHQRIETFHFADSKLVRQIIGNGPSGPNREVCVKASKTVRLVKSDCVSAAVRNYSTGQV